MIPNESRPKVLFVDDEPRLLNAMRLLFRRDCDVFVAEGGRQALSMLDQEPVDVIVSDQRMPRMTGIEFLREARISAPNAMRILLTGYADLDAAVGAVNDGEVFRFVNKPWDNQELRKLVLLAADISRQEKVEAKRLTDTQERKVAQKVGVLLFDDDQETIRIIKRKVSELYETYVAGDIDSALKILDDHEIGVLMCDTQVKDTEISNLIFSLKQHHPEIVTVVITRHADMHSVTELINQGQIFRFLPKPVKIGVTRLSVISAMKRYFALTRKQESVARYQVALPSPEVKAKESGLDMLAISQRVRAIRKQFASWTKH